MKKRPLSTATYAFCALALMVAVAALVFHNLFRVEVSLPNAYTLRSESIFPNTDRSRILAPSGRVIQTDILDFVVQNSYVYGCYGTPSTTWFILNTADGAFLNGLDSKSYRTELERRNLPVVYIGYSSINVLEIRAGHKKIYW